MKALAFFSKTPEQRTRLAPAYTLTEMLVVLVIIGLLVAVVGPRLFSRLDDAKRRTAHLQMTSLQTSLDLYRLDMGGLPTAEQGLDALIRAPEGDGSAWLGPYLARGQIPLDPWGHAYAYEVDAERAHDRITCYGADGRPGGAGTAADFVVGMEANADASASPPAQE